MGLLAIIPCVYGWILTEIDTHSGFVYVYPATEVNIFNTNRNLEQKAFYVESPTFRAYDQKIHL